MTSETGIACKPQNLKRMCRIFTLIDTSQIAAPMAKNFAFHLHQSLFLPSYMYNINSLIISKWKQYFELKYCIIIRKQNFSYQNLQFNSLISTSVLKEESAKYPIINCGRKALLEKIRKKLRAYSRKVSFWAQNSVDYCWAWQPLITEQQEKSRIF